LTSISSQNRGVRLPFAARRDNVFPMLRTISTAVLSLCLGGTSLSASADTAGEVGVGQTLPGVVMTGLNGPSRNLADFRGKPLLINVWASWCGPCRAEMASLERLAWRDDAGYFNVIGISTDDYTERAQEALAKSNATISHFIDHDLVLENLLGASRLPLTVLVDADGRVVQKVYGAREWDSAAALLVIDGAFHGAQPAP
jgi:thiol-disulfide isomerase/thioredoxin